jgi:hypothetical protein
MLDGMGASASGHGHSHSGSQGSQLSSNEIDRWHPSHIQSKHDSGLGHNPSEEELFERHEFSGMKGGNNGSAVHSIR